MFKKKKREKYDVLLKWIYFIINVFIVIIMEK